MKNILILIFIVLAFSAPLSSQAPLPIEQTPSEMVVCTQWVNSAFGYVYMWGGKALINNEYLVKCKIKYIRNYFDTHLYFEYQCNVLKGFEDKIELIDKRYKPDDKLVCVYKRL